MNRYLGPYPERMMQKIRERAPGWFLLADDVATFCSDLVPRIAPNINDGQQVLSAVLYRRVLSAFEGVLLLAERGMHTEGLILRRGMIEALFVLGAIWQKPDLVRTYVQNDQHWRLRSSAQRTPKRPRAQISWCSSNKCIKRLEKLALAF